MMKTVNDSFTVRNDHIADTGNMVSKKEAMKMEELAEFILDYIICHPDEFKDKKEETA